ncbi:hypothetical protein V8E52_010595 [Russula decolorans]
MYNTRIALLSRAIRLVAPAVQRPPAYAHARAVSTVGPRAAAPDPTRPTATPGTEGPKKPQNWNALYIGGGMVGLGAIWYYYAMGENGRTANQLGHQKRPEKERMQESIKSGDAKYQDIKAEAQTKVQSAKDQVGQGLDRGRQRLEGGLDQAAHRAAEAQATVEQKVDGAKNTGKGWLSWGRSESQASINDLKRRVDETQEAWVSRFEDAKRKAAEKGEDIKQHAEETEEQFRDRIAKAIQRR